MMKLVVTPLTVTLIVYEAYFLANVRAGIVTRPEEETLIFPKETPAPFEPTKDTVPVAEGLKPVRTIRVGTSTGI